MKNILVAYDGFSRNASLPEIAVELALEHEAKLSAVHVLEAPREPWIRDSVSAQELHEWLVEARRTQLEELMARVAPDGVARGVSVRVGAIHVEIIREALALNADLVVVTDGPDRRGFGTVTQKLIRKCPTPVLVKRVAAKREHRRVLAAVNVVMDEGRDEGLNDRILDTACAFASRANAELVVLHAWELFGERLLAADTRLRKAQVRELLDDTRRRREEALHALIDRHGLQGLDARVELVKGSARTLLPELAEEWDVDLVVLGTVSRSGLSGLLIGNTAERVLDALQCSVLAIKPAGFVSPVGLAEGTRSDR